MSPTSNTVQFRCSIGCSPRRGRQRVASAGTGSARIARSASGTTDVCLPQTRQSHCSLSQWHHRRVPSTNASIALLAQPVAPPTCAFHKRVNRIARSASGTTDVCLPQTRQSHCSLSQWHHRRVPSTNASIALLAQPVAPPTCAFHKRVNRIATATCPWLNAATPTESKPANRSAQQDRKL
jgi:hypothetical protein